MDITPHIPNGRQVFSAYGDGILRVSGTPWSQPVLVFPEVTLPWELPAELCQRMREASSPILPLSLDDLAPVFAHLPRTEVLLIGCGPKMLMLPPALRVACREKGVSCDTMDSGGACRTFNVLVAEDRRVAAAVLPV